MTIKIELTEDEKVLAIQEYIRRLIPVGYEIKEIYPTIGEIVIGKIEE